MDGRSDVTCGGSGGWSGSIRGGDGSNGLLYLCAGSGIASNDAGRAGILFVASGLALAALETAEVLDAAVAGVCIGAS